MAERMQFMAGEGRNFEGSVNYIIGNGYYAEISVPDGASEDYGYLTLKQALIERCPETADYDWWYDGQEDKLAEDAGADKEVYIDNDDVIVTGKIMQGYGKTVREYIEEKNISVDEIKIVADSNEELPISENNLATVFYEYCIDEDGAVFYI